MTPADRHRVPCDETSAADAMVRRLRPITREDGVRVGSLVPEGFAAYARVFHPLPPRHPRWAELAAASHIAFSPLLRWEELSDTPAGLAATQGGQLGPSVGTLPIEECRRLTAMLVDHTSTAGSCWFCIWPGYGVLPDYRGPLVRTQWREYLLFAGPIEDATSFIFPPWFLSPNLWWPEDAAWCVATDIDWDSTFIGGTVDCISAVLSDPELETLPIEVGAVLTEWR